MLKCRYRRKSNGDIYSYVHFKINSDFATHGWFHRGLYGELLYTQNMHKILVIKSSKMFDRVKSFI